MEEGAFLLFPIGNSRERWKKVILTKSAETGMGVQDARIQVKKYGDV